MPRRPTVPRNPSVDFRPRALEVHELRHAERARSVTGRQPISRRGHCRVADLCARVVSGAGMRMKRHSGYMCQDLLDEWRATASPPRFRCADLRSKSMLVIERHTGQPSCWSVLRSTRHAKSSVPTCCYLCGGTRVKNRVPPKPMCRQVLIARTCRALLSCCRPFSIFSGSVAVGRAHCPCTSGATPTCRSGDGRVFASSTNGVSRGGRSSVAVALSRRDSRTTKRV